MPGWAILLCVACSDRPAMVGDGATARDAAGDMDAIAGDLQAFCSGTSTRATVNGAALSLEQVKGKDYVSAAHGEGARVELVAAGAGKRWEIAAQVEVALGHTLTDRPLPRQARLESTPGLEADVFFRWPPFCRSGPSCDSDLLATEYHSFRGHMRLRGTSYDGPLQLELCLSADDAGSATAPRSEVHTVQLHVPAVTIPRWRLY